MSLDAKRLKSLADEVHKLGQDSADVIQKISRIDGKVGELTALFEQADNEKSNLSFVGWLRKVYHGLEALLTAKRGLLKRDYQTKVLNTEMSALKRQWGVSSTRVYDHTVPAEVQLMANALAVAATKHDRLVSAGPSAEKPAHKHFYSSWLQSLLNVLKPLREPFRHHRAPASVALTTLSTNSAPEETTHPAAEETSV